MFLNCSTCFGRHTAHHQELKNCNCSLWFYIRFRLPAAAMAQPSSHRSSRQPKTYVKPEAAITVFELLMMGGVSPETCWAIEKHWNIKFYNTVVSCWFFLWMLYYNARIHEHQVSKLSYSYYSPFSFCRLLQDKWFIKFYTNKVCGKNVFTISI
jgi:hypothetical protein